MTVDVVDLDKVELDWQSEALAGGFAQVRDQVDDPDHRDRVLRALGVLDRAVDVNPGGEQLHYYWTKGKGLAKWATSPHPWTTLYRHLVKYVGPVRAKEMASRWFIEVFGFAAGSDKNRVLHGKPPRGKKIGPG